MDYKRPHITLNVRLSTKVRRWLAIGAFLSTMLIIFRTCGHMRPIVYNRDIWSSENTEQYSCAAQPFDDAIWGLSGANGTHPFAILPAAQPGDRSTLRVTAGQSVCIRVVVPPIRSPSVLARQEKDIVELYQPLPNEPTLWDSIILDAVGQKSGISIPIKLRPVQHISMVHRNALHVYEGELQAFDEDVFSITGSVEYREGSWNYEQPSLLPSIYSPEQIAVVRNVQVAVHVPRTSTFHPENHIHLPICQHADEPGRWVDASAMPPTAESQGIPVFNNKVWLPYRCRLRNYSYSDFLRCLEEYRPLSPDSTGKYTIHWFGDANTRRALKKISSLGQWCSGIMANRPQCICDDSGESFGRFTGQNTVRDTLLELNDEDGGWSVRENGQIKERGLFHSQAKIYFHRWEGLTQYNGGRWQDIFRPSAISQYPRANLVVVSLGNMDVSFTQFLEYSRQLNELVALLQAVYEDQHILLRMPQYFCCRAPSGNPTRRMQKDRNRLYGEYAQRLFELHFGQRLHMWDVGSIVETLPLDQRKQVAACAVNTVPSEIVDLENLQLINGLCNPALLRTKPPRGNGRDPVELD